MTTSQPLGQARPASSRAPIKKHICGTCHKGFDTKAKQRQHRKAAHPLLNAATTPTTTRVVASSTPAPKPKAKSARQTGSVAIPAVPEKTASAVGTPPAAALARTAKSIPRKESTKSPIRSEAATPGQTSQPVKAVKTTPAAVAHVRPTPQLVVGLDTPHRGHVYTKLSTVEQSTIQQKLLGLCHSKERLEKEGYEFADCTLPLVSPQPPEPPVPAMTSKAIVIDCEMAGTAENDNELIHLTIIDFSTGRALLDRLVNPTRPIADWRTAITGIDAAMMQAAVRNNTALDGHEAACAELWKIVDKNDSNTVLIGQSLQKDLTVLHTTPHATRVIDTAVLTAEAILGAKKSIKMRKRWGLKELCDSLLGFEIRRPGGPLSGQEGAHDALEDVLATREVVLCRLLLPDQFKRWAQQVQKDFYKGKPKSKKKKHSHMNERDYDDDYEVLRWEDVVDWDTWPKSPPSSP